MNKAFLQNIDYLKWSFVIFALSFSFGLAVNSIAFVILLVVSTGYIIKDLKKGNLQFDKSSLNISLLIFFTYLVFREIFANEGTFELFIKYSGLLLIPLAIAFNSKRLSSCIPLILKAFLVGCIINLTVNWGFAIYRGIIIREEGVSFWYFTYNFFAEPFRIQPIYLAFFYVFAVFILYRYHTMIKGKILFYIILFALCLGILLLSARNALMNLFVLTPILLIIEKRISIKKVLLVFGIFGISFFLGIQNPVVKNRIFKVNKKGNFFSGTSLRLNIWESALDASKDNFIFGVGERKSQKVLISEYKERKMIFAIKKNYNAHNQFLQTLLGYGLVGLVLFLFIFFHPVRIFFLRKNYLALFWVILFILTAVTDSVFMRKWGLLSFAFFTSLFLIDTQKKVIESKK